MPQTSILVFRDEESVPLIAWLDELEQREPRAFHKCLERILALSILGNELRRPHADILRDGIYELRAKVGTVNYRMLYFFCGSDTACLSHGFTKKGAVPDAEIDRAVGRKKLVERDLDKYSAEWDI